MRWPWLKIGKNWIINFGLVPFPFRILQSTSIEDIIRTCNPIVKFSKFTSNKMISEEFEEKPFTDFYTIY